MRALLSSDFFDEEEFVVRVRELLLLFEPEFAVLFRAVAVFLSSS